MAAAFYRRFGRPPEPGQCQQQNPASILKSEPFSATSPHPGCSKFHHVERKLPGRPHTRDHFAGIAATKEAQREFCKIQQNVAELDEKMRKKCLIRDVIGIDVADFAGFCTRFAGPVRTTATW